MNLIYREMGKRMREARETLGLTQEKVAETVGIEPAYHGQLERGRREPSLKTLFKIAKCLKTEVSLLLAEEKNREEFTYQNIKGMIEDLSGRQQKFVVGLLRDTINNLQKTQKN